MVGTCSPTSALADVDVVLPALSVTLTPTDRLPSVSPCRRVGVSARLKVPLAAVVVTNWVPPMVTTTREPASAPVIVPPMVWPSTASATFSRPSPNNGLMVIEGAVSLTTAPADTTCEVFPAGSVTDAVTVRLPLVRVLNSAGVMVAVNAPLLPTVASTVVLPTVTWTIDPATALFTVPLMV